MVVSIYPEVTIERPSAQALIRTERTPGLVVTEVWTLAVVVTDRSNCYCCSCGDYSSDPFCRNHGFAGERPCEVHGMPGTPDERGVMPESVQVARGRRS